MVLCVPPDWLGGFRKPLGIQGQSECSICLSPLLSHSFSDRSPAGLCPDPLMTAVPPAQPWKHSSCRPEASPVPAAPLVREPGRSPRWQFCPQGTSAMSRTFLVLRSIRGGASGVWYVEFPHARTPRDKELLAQNVKGAKGEKPETISGYQLLRLCMFGHHPHDRSFLPALCSAHRCVAGNGSQCTSALTTSEG